MKKTALILLLAVSGAAWAEPTVKLRMDVAPKEITIGDPIRCDVTVIYSSGLAPSPLTAPATGEFELLAALAPQIKVLPSDETQMTYPMLMTTFSTGTLTLPPFIVSFLTADGQHVEAKTQPIDIHVISVLEKSGDEGKLRPLKGTFNYKSYFWLWVILLIAMCGVLAYLLIHRARRKKKNAGEPEGPPKPAEETAWEALQKLEDSDLRATGQMKEYYVRLSNILRGYLEQRFDVSSMESTTYELLGEIRKLDLPLETTMALRVFIENSDLVKFAKYTPDDEQIDGDLVRVKQFITETTPQKPVEPEKIPV